MRFEHLLRVSIEQAFAALQPLGGFGSEPAAYWAGDSVRESREPYALSLLIGSAIEYFREFKKDGSSVHLAGCLGCGSICTVAVIPAARTTPSGT